MYPHHFLEYEDTINNESKIEYTMNSRGGLYLVYGGFQFAKEKHIGNKVYWVCKEKRPFGCKARVSHDTKLNKVTIVNDNHNHEARTKRRGRGEYQKHLDDAKNK